MCLEACVDDPVTGSSDPRDLETPRDLDATAFSPDTPSRATGSGLGSIGPYRLLAKLGEGGWGRCGWRSRRHRSKAGCNQGLFKSGRFSGAERPLQDTAGAVGVDGDANSRGAGASSSCPADQQRTPGPETVQHFGRRQFDVRPRTIRAALDEAEKSSGVRYSSAAVGERSRGPDSIRGTLVSMSRRPWRGPPTDQGR